MVDNKEKKLTLEDQNKEDEKQLKKLLEAYTAVASHKLGRPAKLDDLVKMLNENESQEDLDKTKVPSPVAANPVASRSTDAASDSTPRQASQDVSSEHTASEPNESLEKDEGTEPGILHMKIYHGMSGEGDQRKPDPSNILFYQTPDNRWFDTQTQSWTETAPMHAEHLPSRPIEFNEKDIVAAIAHGVMEPDDFDNLDKAGMIGHTPRQLWSAMNRLKSLHEDLAKSEEGDQEGITSEAPVDPDLEPGEPTQGAGIDVLGEYLKTAGVQGKGEEMTGEGEVGQDLIAQIMEAAVAAVSEANDGRIRDIIREELKALGLYQDQEPQEDLPEETE